MRHQVLWNVCQGVQKLDLAREHGPTIVEAINSFKEYWADTIALVNQTAVPALQHGYGLTAMDNNVLVVMYDDLLTNFGAAFAATLETMKSQAGSLVAMQNQLLTIQLCMNVGQQPPSSAYTPHSATTYVY
jgi:hypothetical protein